MGRRLTIELLQSEFKERGYQLLETKYLGTAVPMRYLCSTHGEQTIRYTNFYMGKGCRQCSSEDNGIKSRLDYSIVEKEFTDANYELLPNQLYTGVHCKLKYICKQHGLQEIDYTHLTRGQGCFECGRGKISILKSGENNHNFGKIGKDSINWKGGITQLSEHLRKLIIPWITDSMKQCNFKCIITNSEDWHVHHLTSFNIIVRRTMDELKLPIHQNIGDYTTQELNDINTRCLQLHYKYGLGVCLDKTLHALFHSQYKFGDNTPEQFQEFQQRYLSGEFKE